MASAKADWLWRLGFFILKRSIRLYYRRVEVLGRERIPASWAVILVANHPNSAADGFLVASELTYRRVNFIAKDTLTRHPLLGPLLRRFGVVGVARPREYERQRDLARDRNRAALDACVPRLLAGEIIAIFGEGVSTDLRRLHMVRKGAMRFGYAAEQAAGFGLGLVWVPVGINYSAKHHFRSEVLIRLGEPFRVAELGVALENEAEILERGTARLQGGLESLVVNIERQEQAEIVDRLADLLGSRRDSLAARVERHQRVARAVAYFNQTEPQRLAEIEQALEAYGRRLDQTGLTDDVIRQRHPTLSLWVHLLGMLQSSGLMLLSLYGWANSFIPRWTATLAGPLGRRRTEVPGSPPIEVAGMASWGIFGGWIGAAVAFPLQIWLVFGWVESAYGAPVAAAAAGLYGLTLLPSWRWYLHSREILRRHYKQARDALRFLMSAGPATRLQARRRRLVRRVQEMLAAYDAQGPRAASRMGDPAS